MSKKDDKLQSIFETISIGHHNAIVPPKKLENDFSNYVDNKNYNGDIVIKSDKGYYRPFPMDDIDSEDFSKYIESEYNRGIRIIEKCDKMTRLYSRIEEKIIKEWMSNET